MKQPPRPCAKTAVQRGLQFDFGRLSQVLMALDSYAGKWNQQTFFRNLEQRIKHGVPLHLVDLCQLPNIGRVRANKLYEKGIKTCEDIANADFSVLKKILGLKEELVHSVVQAAKKKDLGF